MLLITYESGRALLRALVEGIKVAFHKALTEGNKIMFTLYIYEIPDPPDRSVKELLVHQSTHKSDKDAMDEWKKYSNEHPSNGNTLYYHIIDIYGKHYEP